MKIRMFQDLEARDRNWYKKLSSVLWALRTNINRATRDTPFNLVYEAEAVLPLEIYLKSVRVQRELNVGDLVLKKDIRTKDKHKFSTLWEGSFIIVDVAALGAYVLAEVDDDMLPNTWNVDQLRKYYI
jgi:hypothetical protein